ncbi:hypothetical protein Aperf_G00000128077 [Anoplocephala perfoliata]
MVEVPPILCNSLSSGTQAFIIYFCALRSQKYKYIQIKSVTANSKSILSNKSSCLLRLGLSPESSWRIAGDEVTERWIYIENKDSITALLCQYSSEVPVLRQTVEIRVAKDPSDASNAKTIQFDCLTNILNEEGVDVIDIDSNGEQLDVYYLSIRPTLPLELEGGQQASPAVGFQPKAVGSAESSLLCIGHRGMGMENADVPVDKRWPENTIISFMRAGQLGIPMIEFDVLPMRDSDDLVIYHNFNVITKKSDRNRKCGCPVYEVDVFADTGVCNKTMPNLIPTLSPNEIKDLKWGQHTKFCEKNLRELEESEMQCQNTADFQEMALRHGSKSFEYLPFFSDVLEKVPIGLSLDIELKYPQDNPYMSFRLQQEYGLPEEMLAEFGHPSRYFYSMNKFADNVIRALQTYGRGRAVILSTFNADLCLALRLKQSTFPVIFNSRAGFEPDMPTNLSYSESSRVQLPPPPHGLDPRHRNAAAAIEWAHLIGAEGVVIRGEALTEEEGGTKLARQLKEYRLACIPYGPCVSTPEFKNWAEKLGITGICVDNVESNRW